MEEVAKYESGKKEGAPLIPVSEALFNSKLFPNVVNKFGAFAVVQYGAELGVGPMTSLQTMSIVKGKICMAAQMMLTLAIKRGVKYKVLSDSNTECKVHFERDGYSPYESSFSIEDAKKAGIYRPDSGWEKFPKDMLFWRTVTRGLRRICPDVILGLYAKEEIEDAPAINAPFQESPSAPELPEERKSIVCPKNQMDIDESECANCDQITSCAAMGKAEEAPKESGGKTPEVQGNGKFTICRKIGKEPDYKVFVGFCKTSCKERKTCPIAQELK